MTLADELEKQRVAHFYKLTEILIEKLLLAAVFFIIAWLGNWAIENYKSTLEKQHFFLESRLQGLQELSDAYSKLVDFCYLYGSKEGVLSDDEKAKHEAALQDFMSSRRQWGFLFSDDFVRRIDHHIWFHDAVVTQSVEIKREDYGFILDVSQNFDELTRVALREDTLGLPTERNSNIFQLTNRDPSEMATVSGKEYFEENLNSWKSKQKEPSKKRQ